MDILSFFRNRESNLMIRNTDAVADLKRHFLADLGSSLELTRERLAQVSFWKIVIGYLARSLKSFL
jgi:phosphatidylserine/phosphatidylglycerophosphate/cardiolipin synthase-like enzyme